MTRPEMPMKLMMTISYGGREGPFQNSHFSISISVFVISKVAFPKLLFPNLLLTTLTFMSRSTDSNAISNKLVCCMCL